MFLTKEAVRLATEGVALGVACEGCPPIPELMQRFETAGGELLDVPDLLQRQATRRGHARVQRPTRRNRPALGVDRRRRHHLQLLTGPTPVERNGRRFQPTSASASLDAIAAQDAAALKALLAPDVNFRALTPGKSWESEDADAVVDDVILGKWFPPERSITAILRVDRDASAPSTTSPTASGPDVPTATSSSSSRRTSRRTMTGSVGSRSCARDSFRRQRCLDPRLPLDPDGDPIRMTR